MPKKEEEKKDSALVKRVLDLTTVTTEEALEVIHSYINPHATKPERMQFLHLCQEWNLDPFKRDIYLIKYSPRDPAAIVMGYEVFLKRADTLKEVTGWKAWTEGDPRSKDFVAKIVIHRKSYAHPFEHEVYWDEYAQKTRDGTYTKFWNKMPRTMLKKVVISQGFRLCFPNDLGGMPYTEAEFHVEKEGVSSLPVIEVVPEEPKKKEEKTAEPPPKEEPPVMDKTEVPIIPPVPEEEPPPIEEPSAKVAPEPKAAEPPKQAEEPPLIEPPTKEEARIEKPSSDMIDMINLQIKTLVNSYQKDPDDIRNKLAALLKGDPFNTTIKPENIPTDLNKEEALYVQDVLDATIGKERTQKKTQATLD